MSLIGNRENRALRGACGLKTDSMSVRKFEDGELVLVAHGETLKKGGIWPVFQPILYGPCLIVAAIHPRYELVSSTGKSTRRPVHTRRLVRYHSRGD